MSQPWQGEGGSCQSQRLISLIMPVLEKVRWWDVLEATSTDEVQVPNVQVESELVI